MSGLEGLNRRVAKKGEGQNREFAANERVSFKVVKFHTANADGTPSAEDYLEVVLTRPALGIVPAMIDGQPGPVVKLKYRPNPHASAPTVAKFRDGSGSVKKMSGKMAVGMAEGCYFKASENTIYTKWLVSFMPATSKLSARPVLGQMVRAHPERDGKGENKKPYMHNIVAVTDKAEVFVGMEEFRASAVKAMVSAVDADFPGQRGFILRAHQLVDGAAGSASIEVLQSWNKDAGAYDAPEKAIDDFLARVAGVDELKGWIDTISNTAATDLTLEVIPMLRYKIGSMSVRSARIENAEKQFRLTNPGKEPNFSAETLERYDDSLSFQAFENEDDLYPQSMFVRSDMRVIRNETTVDNREIDEETEQPIGPAPEKTWGPWFVTGTWQNSHKPVLFSARELITPNLSAEVVQAFTEKGSARKSVAELNAIARSDAKKAAALPPVTGEVPAPKQEVPAEKPAPAVLPQSQVEAHGAEDEMEEDHSMGYGVN